MLENQCVKKKKKCKDVKNIIPIDNFFFYVVIEYCFSSMEKTGVLKSYRNVTINIYTHLEAEGGLFVIDF